ncbi:MAG: Lpg1974 family pore-forming outer membrane protein [Parachlamydiales bacterium]
MNRWLLLLTLATVPLQATCCWSRWAHPCCDPCPPCCGGSFEVGGQWIYLRASSCDFPFVIRDGREFDATDVGIPEVVARLPYGKGRGVAVYYQSGFRASVGYLSQSGCQDVRIEYTYHHPSDSRRLFAGFIDRGLWPIPMHPRYAANVNLTGTGANTFDGFETPLYCFPPAVEGDCFAWSSLNVDYDAVDLQLGARTVEKCTLSLRGYTGLHYLNLDLRQRYQYSAFSAGLDGVVEPPIPIVASFQTDLLRKQKLWGIGPLLGGEGRLPLFRGVGIGGHLGIALLAGETSTRYDEHDVRNFNFDGPVGLPDVDEEATLFTHNRGILFPLIRGSLGVNYRWCCGDCLTVLGEVGYEFNSYINCVGHFQFNDQRGTGMALCDSYNLDGFYVSLRALL